MWLSVMRQSVSEITLQWYSTLTKMYWLLGRKSKPSTNNKLLLCNAQTNLDLRNTTLGYGFHIQQRNFGTFPVEDLAHVSRRTSVRADYGYPKGSPNTNSWRRNPPLQLSIQFSPQCTSKSPSSKPHGAARQATAKTPANDVSTRFLAWLLCF
jgi:hypothetical protein